MARVLQQFFGLPRIQNLPAGKAKVLSFESSAYSCQREAFDLESFRLNTQDFSWFCSPLWRWSAIIVAPPSPAVPVPLELSGFRNRPAAVPRFLVPPRNRYAARHPLLSR